MPPAPINAAQAFNVPKDVSFGEGLLYQVYELDFNDLAAFESWANGVLLGQFEELWKTIGPLLAVAASKSPDDAASLAVIEALKYMERVAADRTRTYFRIGSEEVDQLMWSTIGARELLFLAIKHGRPEFTRPEAWDLFGKCSVGFVASIPELVGLVAPAHQSETDPDPKGASASSPSGEPTPGATTSSTDGASPAAST